MPNTKFDSKSFNPEAFGRYVERIPNVKKNQLIQSGAVGTNENAKTALASQTGSLYARIPYFGRISGATSQNNDGGTDITSTSTTTYEQGFVTASRMDSWTERSFSKNITAGVDFMDNVARQIADYKLEVKQAMLLAILNGVFSMSTTGGSVAAKAAKEFIDKHTYDISGKTGEDALVGATTLNTAIQQACGDNKNIFKLVIMHSAVATTPLCPAAPLLSKRMTSSCRVLPVGRFCRAGPAPLIWAPPALVRQVWRHRQGRETGKYLQSQPGARQLLSGDPPPLCRWKVRGYHGSKGQG